jgi:hypothetical protein
MPNRVDNRWTALITADGKMISLGADAMLTFATAWGRTWHDMISNDRPM